MTKLSNTQLVILNRAAQRDDHAVASLGEAKAEQKAVAALIKAGLLKTAPKKPDLAIWQPSPDEPGTALVITAAALKTLGMDAVVDGATHGADAAASKRSPLKGKAVSVKKARPTQKGSKAKSGASAAAQTKAAGIAKQLGKVDSLVALMRRKSGATIDELMAATGWQSHSVRGAISGAVKKKLGLDVISERIGKTRTYSIAR